MRLMSLAIVVTVFLIFFDRLLRSVWAGCSKGHASAVMLLNGVSNSQGTCPNPQYGNLKMIDQQRFPEERFLLLE